MIAALVFSTKPRSTSSDQRKICTGRTVAASVTPSGGVGDERAHADHQQRRGFAERTGHADDRAGQDAGQRQRQRRGGTRPASSTRRRPAPPSRIDGGTALIALRPAMTITGMVISASVRPPTSGADRGMCEEVEEHREAEQAEDDRGHRGEIVDRDLDQVGPAVLGREFLEIDGGHDADREGRAASVTSMVSAEPDQRAEDAGEFGLAAVATHEELGC